MYRAIFDHSNYGHVERTIVQWLGEDARPRQTTDKVCLGIIDSVHCPIRVSCARYQGLRPDSKEFVRAEDFSSQGHKDLGCNEYRWILPDESKNKILTFERAVKKYVE